MADPLPPEPLSVDEVKRNLRYTNADQDALLTGFIVAAREYVEAQTDLVLTPRAVTETVPALGNWIDLVSWPITSVAGIRYPVAGVMTALAGTAWTTSVKRRPVRVLPASSGWGVSPTNGAVAQLPVEIDVNAGYAAPALVPQMVKQAMQLLVAHWWGNRAAAEVGARAAAIEVPFGVDELLRGFKMVRV